MYPEAKLQTGHKERFVLSRQHLILANIITRNLKTKFKPFDPALHV